MRGATLFPAERKAANYMLSHSWWITESHPSVEFDKREGQCRASWNEADQSHRHRCVRDVNHVGLHLCRYSNSAGCETEWLDIDMPPGVAAERHTVRGA